MSYRFNEKENDKMVRYFERNMNPEKRIKLMYEEIIKSERMNSMKIYSVKCRVYQRPYYKIVAATSEDKVKELLSQKEKFLEIEDIVEMEIESAQVLHCHLVE